MEVALNVDALRNTETELNDSVIDVFQLRSRKISGGNIKSDYANKKRCFKKEEEPFVPHIVEESVRPTQNPEQTTVCEKER